VDAAQTRAFVLTSDFVTGGLSVVDLDTRAVMTDVASVHHDARARWAFGKLYVLNRFGADNVQVIDPGASFATVRQFSTGNGSNPSDIVVVAPDKAYVSLYGTAYLQVVDPNAGMLGPTIDLTALADADGLPEADRMARFGRWLFVAIQRLDRNGGFVPTDTSLVAVVDLESDALVDVDPMAPGVQGIVLPATNPVTTFVWDGDARRFYLGCAGAYGALDGGIVVIDPETLVAQGLAATEVELGGDLGDIEWHTATHGYAIVSDPSFNTKLITWNPATGLATGTVSNPGGFSLSDCARNDRGEIYLANNGLDAPGVYIYSTATDLALVGPLSAGLPPSQVLFDALGDDVVGVTLVESLPGLDFAPPKPCPARSNTVFEMTLEAPASVNIEVFDPAGRRIRILASGAFPKGKSSVAWDLRDQDGRSVGPGIFLARVAGPRSLVTRKVVVTH
jgi:DNA-binding beta-propeller fold protein YncE